MTDFESNGNQNLTCSASADNLSLKNWMLPVEEPKKSCDNSETETTGSGLNSLIPQYIRDICKVPKSSELRVSYDAPTLQTTYTYSITWDVEEDSDEKYIKILETSASTEKLRSSKSFSSLRIGGPPAPVTARCDGPCKRDFPSNLLSTIGRCGHYLCTACYGIVRNNDGTNGCSSLQCFWKGTSREESKKNYEKDVCRKQRAKARDMNSRGIDVKPASAASSTQELSSKDSTSSATNSETSTVSGPLTVVPSIRKPIKPDPPIKVRMVLVEPDKGYGMTHSSTYVELKIAPFTTLVRALEMLLHRKKKYAEDYIPTGKLYYGLLKDNEKLGMRRIKFSSYDGLVISDVPKLNDRLVLILDMGDFVTTGVKIYLE